MKLLDFANMRKIGGDNKTTTFKHEDGHEIKVMHGALSKIHQEQIKRLPIHKEELGLANGGRVQNFDDGTPDSPIEVEKVSDPSSEPIEADRVPDAPASHDTHITINAAPATAPVAASAAAAPIPQSTSPERVAQVPSEAVNTGIRGANEQMGADIAKAQGMVPISQQQQQNAQEIQDRQNQTIADMKKHTDEFSQYLNANPINSRRLLQDQTAEQKWQTGIGLFLGGLGGGGRSNIALDYLNKSIDRDIDEQKSNADQKKTIWGAYQHLYGDENVSTALTKVSMNDKLIADTNLLAAKLGTAQASANRDALVSKLQLDSYNAMQNAAGYYQASAGSGPSPSSEGSAGGVPSGQILNQSAQDKYKRLLYDPTKTPQQKADIEKQYNEAIQSEKALAQIDQLYPQLQDKATWGGYFADKVNPNILGGAIAAGTEALGVAGAIPTAGASLAGAIPGAIAAGAAGTAAGHGIKQGLTAMGGQQEIQYQNAKKALTPIIASALGNNVTPSEAAEIAEQFAPSKIDSAETAKDKLDKLKQKIKALSHTGALDAAGMTVK